MSARKQYPHSPAHRDYLQHGKKKAIARIVDALELGSYAGSLQKAQAVQKTRALTEEENQNAFLEAVFEAALCTVAPLPVDTLGEPVENRWTTHPHRLPAAGQAPGADDEAPAEWRSPKGSARAVHRYPQALAPPSPP